MKKRNMIIGYLILLTLAFAFFSTVYAATAKHESAGEYLDDSVITTKVKTLLAEDGVLKSFKINVKTYKGKVQLSGFVDSQEAVNKAGEITKTVKGVKSVKNSLTVK
jgi:osmotically-inducible protein OsmY